MSGTQVSCSAVTRREGLVQGSSEGESVNERFKPGPAGVYLNASNIV